MESDIAVDLFPFFRILGDGTVQRFMGTDTVHPSPHIKEPDGVASKDVILDPKTGVFVRLYLPRLHNNSGEKVPVVLYIHGGGFCVESAASPPYHNYLNLVAKEANVICVSVNYRRVPEHRLPAAYDDCFAALQWLARQANGCEEEAWLRSHADFTRCFVAGDSAGANIVHQVGIRAGGDERNWGCLRVEGAIVVHPFFSGEERVREVGVEAEGMVKVGDGIWKMSLPQGANRDHPFSNPLGPQSPDLSDLVYDRIIVFVAEKDLLKERAILYYRGLKKAGKVADLVIAEDEQHVFHLKDPACPNALLMMKRISEFIHSPLPQSG